MDADNEKDDIKGGLFGDPDGFGWSEYGETRAGPRYEEDKETTRWGLKKMTRTPHAAKGMQFVNVDHLMDLKDMKDFEKRISEALN